MFGDEKTVDKTGSIWDEIHAAPPEEPKKKIKKQFEGWVNLYENKFSTINRTKELADRYAAYDRKACIYVTGEYEVNSADTES